MNYSPASGGVGDGDNSEGEEVQPKKMVKKPMSSSSSSSSSSLTDSAEQNSVSTHEVELDSLLKDRTIYLLRLPSALQSILTTAKDAQVKVSSCGSGGETLVIEVTDPMTKQRLECPVSWVTEHIQLQQQSQQPQQPQQVNPQNTSTVLQETRPAVILSHSSDTFEKWKADGIISKVGHIANPVNRLLKADSSSGGTQEKGFRAIATANSAKTTARTLGQKRSVTNALLVGGGGSSSASASVPGGRFESTTPRMKMARMMESSMLSPSEVTSKIFELFKEKRQWTITEISRRITHPLEPLRRAVNDVCAYNTAVKAFELKSEYAVVL